jgi:hypothetical protein
MTPSVLDPAAQARPAFAAPPVSAETRQAWEQLGPLRDALLDLFAQAAPHLAEMKVGLQQFASDVEVGLEFLHDHDWHIDAPTIVVRYALEAGWSEDAFTQRDRALGAWYAAPDDVRLRFPPLREIVTVPSDASA